MSPRVLLDSFLFVAGLNLQYHLYIHIYLGAVLLYKTLLYYYVIFVMYIWYVHHNTNILCTIHVVSCVIPCTCIISCLSRKDSPRLSACRPKRCRQRAWRFIFSNAKKKFHCSVIAFSWESNSNDQICNIGGWVAKLHVLRRHYGRASLRAVKTC